MPDIYSSDVIEPAKTSRSRCQQCRKGIEEGDPRFGSDTEGFYSDSSSGYQWYHLTCASQRFPDRLLGALKRLKRPADLVDNYDALVAACAKNQKKADSRYPYGERAPSGRAKCIKCDVAIAKGELRVAIEREINTGAFTTVGAGYLHPACAVAQLNEPNLVELLRNNSKMLEKKDLDELAKLCGGGAAKATDGTATKATNGAKPSADPATDAKPAKKKKAAASGDELVFADQLIEKNDPRGELITVATERFRISPADPRHAALDERIAELEPESLKRWAKDLGLKNTKGLTLHRGLPVLPLGLSPATIKGIPDHPWLVGFDVKNGTEKNLATLLKDPKFARAKRLGVKNVGFSWDGFKGFCSIDEVKALESLDIDAPNARSMQLMLSSSRFENLEHLRIGCGWRMTLDPDTRGYERSAGLPSLRSITFGDGWIGDILSVFLRSPLAQRVTQMELIGGGSFQAFEGHALPNLEHLTIGRVWFPAKAFINLTAKKSLTKLRSLHLPYLQLPPAIINELADPKNLPSLERLDITGGMLGSSSLKKLQDRFGDHLVADNLREEPKPKPKTKPKTKPKAKASPKKTAKKKSAAR